MEEESLQKKESVIANNNNNKNGIIAILVVIIIALIVAVIYFAFVKKEDKTVDNNSENTQEDSGQKIIEDEAKYENKLTIDETAEFGTYGIAYVEGYAKVEEKPMCDDGPDICQGDEPKVNEVSFYVTNRKVDEIKDWFVTNKNNEEYIPLGCAENGVITFTAMADEFYKGDNPNSQENYANEIKLSKEDSDKIIASNENNTIILKIEKKKMKKDIRMGLYTCNSTITGVEVVK